MGLSSLVSTATTNNNNNNNDNDNDNNFKNNSPAKQCDGN